MSEASSEDLAPGFEVLPVRPRHHRGRMLASIGAIVVLAAGGVATYVAFADAGDGANSPKQAVQSVIDDLSHADLVGLLDDLAPNERHALSGAVTADIAALKRLGVLSSSADPTSVSGVHFATHDLTYGRPVKVNDHVQIVQLTGGAIDMSADPAQLPFTQRLLGLGHGASTASQHVDITTPVRIATQQSGGRWYASLFYTVADQAAGHRIPTAADQVAAAGAASPQDAVRTLLRGVMADDVRSAVAVISPSELGALHDYAGLIPDETSHQPSPMSPTLKSIQFTTTPISGGVRVGIAKIVVSIMRRQVSIAFEKDCLSIDAGFFKKQVCAADAAGQIGALIGGALCSGGGFRRGPITAPSGSLTPLGRAPGCSAPRFSAAQQAAIGHLVSALPKLGVDTAREGGKWYVTPVRSIADVSGSVLSSLRNDDLFRLASIDG